MPSTNCHLTSILCQSTVSSLNPVPAISGAMHAYTHQALLETLMPRKVAALALSGFAFFGNSITISTKVEKVRKQDSLIFLPAVWFMG